MNSTVVSVYRERNNSKLKKLFNISSRKETKLHAQIFLDHKLVTLQRAKAVVPGCSIKKLFRKKQNFFTETCA